MNAGFSNLATLKGWLLPASLASSTEYDAQILAIGKGTAALIENFCDRKFARMVGDVFELSADRYHVSLPRYPIEDITTIEQSEPGPVATPPVWNAQVDVIDRQSLTGGLLYFKTPLSTAADRLRVTYTGGFWWNQQEPEYTPPDTPTEEDPDLSVMPAGAVALPEELALGWKLQCEHIWAQRDKLGVQLARDPNDEKPSVAEIQLLPIVQLLVQPFVRYSLY